MHASIKGVLTFIEGMGSKGSSAVGAGGGVESC